MSVEVYTNVIKHAPVRGSDLMVLLMLANYANPSGICWPSIDRISSDARLGDRHVRRILKSLEDDGYISVVHRAGRHKTNIYRVRVFTDGDRPYQAVNDDYENRVIYDMVDEKKRGSVSPEKGVHESKKEGPQTPFSNQDSNQKRGSVSPEKGVHESRKGGPQTLRTVKNRQEPSESISTATPDRDAFSEWWEVYPRKIDKGGSRKAWATLNPSPELADRIIAATIRQSETNFRDVEVKFIPYPTTWLNNERWEDAIIPSGTSDPQYRTQDAGPRGTKDWHREFLAPDQPDDDTGVIDADYHERT